VLTLLLCVLSALEGADLQLLPCAFDALRRDLHLSVGNLAMMATVQALCGTLAAPGWAFLADQRILGRRTILGVGSIGQGLITMLLGCVAGLIPMILLRALNGIMLASLRPVCMGIVADATSEQCRGKVYGRIQFACQLGMVVSTMIATPLSKGIILSLQGWRMVFGVVGSLGILVGSFALVVMEVPEIPHPRVPEHGTHKLIAEAKHFLSFFLSPTFNMLVLQGLFGGFGISSSTFATMYFQMTGINDFQAGLITAFGQVAGAMGVLLGGHMGDVAARTCRKHGRVLVAEVSLSMGVPLMFLRFWGVPPIQGSFLWYCLLTVLHGILAVWVTAGAKLPLLSEIVPAGRRSAVIAWDSTIEGALSSVLGGPMVALLAQTAFGFSVEDLSSGRHSPNAHALGRATAIMSCVPTLLSLACWPLVHLTYPADLKRRAALEASGKCDVRVAVEV